MIFGLTFNFSLYIPLVVFSLLVLLFLSYQDIKYREINITALIIFVIISIFYLWIFIFKSNKMLWIDYLFQLVVCFLFLLFIYLLGKISFFTYIGEGDLYTIMALSFTNIFNAFFPLFIFILALFVTLLVPLVLFIYNLFSKNYPFKKYSFFKAVYLMFLGIPLPINKITTFYMPLEKFSKEGDLIKSKIVFKPNIEPEKEIKIIKSFSEKNNISKIWVSPLVPFIFSILLGYIIVLLLFTFCIF